MPAGSSQDLRPYRRDPLLEVQENAQSSASDAAFAQPELLFGLTGVAGGQAPATVGDVGRREYVELGLSAEATTLTVYDKSTLAVLAGPLTLESLWPEGRGCGADPGSVRYDNSADRWLLVQAQASRLCIHVARTQDPVAGGWHLYQFRVPGVSGGSKFSVWPDAYLVSRRERSPVLYTLERERMLNGAKAGMQRFAAAEQAPVELRAFTPADLDGPLAPPAEVGGLFLRQRDDEANASAAGDPKLDFLELWELHTDSSSRAQSTLSGPIELPVVDFDSATHGLTSQYRRFPTNETLVGGFPVSVDEHGRAGIRWFELRRLPGDGWRLHQEGTYAPDEDHRLLSSLDFHGRESP